MCDGGVCAVRSSDANMTADRRMCYGYSESLLYLYVQDDSNIHELSAFSKH